MNCVLLLEKTLAKILEMATSLKLRSREACKYEFDKFVLMSFYFPGTNVKDQFVYTHIY